jgi:hypothetical protein
MSLCQYQLRKRLNHGGPARLYTFQFLYLFLIKTQISIKQVFRWPAIHSVHKKGNAMRFGQNYFRTFTVTNGVRGVYDNRSRVATSRKFLCNISYTFLWIGLLDMQSTSSKIKRQSLKSSTVNVSPTKSSSCIMKCFIFLIYKKTSFLDAFKCIDVYILRSNTICLNHLHQLHTIYFLLCYLVFAEKIDVIPI